MKFDQKIYVYSLKRGKNSHPYYSLHRGVLYNVEDSEVLLNPELLRGWLFEIKERFFGNSKAIVFLGEDENFWLYREGEFHAINPNKIQIISVIPFFRIIKIGHLNDSKSTMIRYFIPIDQYIFPDTYNEFSSDYFSDKLIEISTREKEVRNDIKTWGERILNLQSK